MNESKLKLEQVFVNSNRTFEELLVVAVNTYISNKENMFFGKRDVQSCNDDLKCN